MRTKKDNWVSGVFFALAVLCFIMAGTVKAELIASPPEKCVSDVEYGPGSCIKKPYEIDNVLITFFWFDTEAEMQQWFFDEYGEFDEDMRSFSGSEPYADKNVCHLDLYAVRPILVDDDFTLSIGHEVIHCVHGPDYHVYW